MKVRNIFIAIILSLNFSANSFAKNIAVMLYTSQEEGDKFYNTHLKSHGIKRQPTSFDKSKNFEYHVSLGFIPRVKDNEAIELQNHIEKSLLPLVQNCNFEFGVSALLGRDIPVIVSLPLNHDVFAKLNNQIEIALNSFNGSHYHLSKFSQTKRYIPHLTLNARLANDVAIKDLAQTMINLNNNLYKVRLPLNNLVVKIEN